MNAISVLIAPVLLVGPAFAQLELPKPHKALADFGRAVGHWTGEGTMAVEGAESRLPWTCTLDLEYVLDGFAVQETLHVDMGEIGSYDMVALYAYDATRSKLVNVKADNYNGVAEGTCQWQGNSLVSASAAMMPQDDGSMVVGAERNVWTFDGDKSTLQITALVGAKEPVVHVEGTMKRVKPEVHKTIEAAHTNVQAKPTLSKNMAPLQGLIGQWHMTGNMVMAPGAEGMKIGGTDDIYAFEGGHAIVATVLGDDMMGFQYKAMGFFGWNDGKQCFDHYAITNMGDVMLSECRLVGPGQLIMTHSGKYQGLPYAERGVFVFGKDGPISVVSDRFAGSEPGFRAFEGRYAELKK